MMANLSGFRKFFFEEMDPSIDKKMDAGNQSNQSDNMDYFGGLGDEMGMEWKDIVTALQGEPWVSAHFGLGSPKHEIMYKKSAWKIVPGTLSANGADIVLVPNKDDRSYLDGGKMLNKGKIPDKKRYHLSREELIGFLTGGWAPAIQAAQQGAAGGGAPGGMPGL